MTATYTPQRDRLAATLNRARRQADLSRLRRETARGDISGPPVIGTGITGVGIALGAASGGLKIVLVESKDLAFSVSHWSSKFARSGLRYLASDNISIVRRSAVERDALFDVTVSHLVCNPPQVVSMMDKFTPPARVLPHSGFPAGDFLRIITGTSVITLPLSRIISSRRVSQLSPTVRKRDVKLGCVNYNDQLYDDIRLATAIARTAASYGATTLTRVCYKNASDTSATLIGELIGESFELPAHAMVDATGIWAAELATNIKVRPPRGTHLILDAAESGSPTESLTVPVPGRINRFCSALPTEYNRVYIGLTDEDAPGPTPDIPKVPKDNIVFLFDVVDQVLEIPLTRDDVIGTLTSPHPLINVDEAYTVDLPHEHALLEVLNNLISIADGKLTEYRLMAERVADKVAEKLGASLASRSTRTVPVLNSEPEALDRTRTAATTGHIPMPLFNHHGVESSEVIESCPLSRPPDPIARGLGVIHVEFTWHVTYEGALSVGDILDRRTRLGLTTADRETAPPAAEEVLGLVQHWSLSHLLLIWSQLLDKTGDLRTSYFLSIHEGYGYR